eukprot:2957353-Pleurochrysis_carterae.AAC.1
MTAATDTPQAGARSCVHKRINRDSCGGFCPWSAVSLLGPSSRTRHMRENASVKQSPRNTRELV